MSEQIVDTIKKRRSVRTFSATPLSLAEKSGIKALLNDSAGPFGAMVRLIAFDLDDLDKAALKSMGTYGMIRGATLFTGAVVKPSPNAFVDLGYRFEELVIKLTSQGYGTCWMAGTFSRAGFAGRAGLRDSEVLGAISPIGRSHDKQSLMEKVVRTVAGSRHRKEWGEIFFDTHAKTALTQETAGAYAVALDCVRIGPSASNKQPWRLVKDGAVIHFFLCRTKGYANFVKNIDFQAMDIGIAMYHFEAAARGNGLGGRWMQRTPGCGDAAWEYVTSWETGA
jgi:hypothetical protein